MPIPSTASSKPLNRFQRWWRALPPPHLEMVLDRQQESFDRLLHTVSEMLSITRQQSQLMQALLDSFTYKGPQDAPQARTFDPELELLGRMEQEGLLGQEEARLYRQDLLTLMKR